MLAILLAFMTMLTMIMPMWAFAGDGGQFTITLKLEKEPYVPFDPAAPLANGDRITQTLMITGATGGVPIDPDATFTVKIPRIFGVSNIDIPKDDENTGALFTVSGPADDPDPAYLVYTFSYSAGYKAALGNPNPWTFTAASLVMQLKAVINSTTTEHNEPIEVYSDESLEVRSDSFTIPDDYASFSIVKSITSVVRRNDDGDWELMPSNTYVKPGDLVMYRIMPTNNGTIAFPITITENLPDGLEGYDELYNTNADVTAMYDAALSTVYAGNFSFNKTNTEPNPAPGPAFISPHEVPAAWTKQGDGTYTITVWKREKSNENPHVLFFAKVKDFVKDSENKDILWTDDQLLNSVTGVYDNAPPVGNERGNPGATLHPELLPPKYDVALQKWEHKIERDGVLLGYAYVNPETAARQAMVGDIVTFAIRVTNQSQGNSPVKFGTIVDYAPTGLEYDDAATRAANGGVDLGWTAGTPIVSPLSDSFMSAAGTVTPYACDLDEIIKPSLHTTIYIAFKVLDLDDVIADADSTKAITSSSTTASIKANRDALLINGRYIPYHNAAEIATAFSLNAGGTATDPAAYTTPIVDDDSTLDDNPFNDLLGDKASVGDYLPKDWLIGKEKDNIITGDAKTTITADEDDYDFARIDIAPKLVKDSGSTDAVIKKWDSLPLLYRVYYGNEASRLDTYMNHILKQITPGNTVGTPVGSSHNGDITGYVYGTYPNGNYHNATNGAYLQELGQKAGLTESYPDPDPDINGAALSDPASEYKLVKLHSDGVTITIDGLNSILMYTVAVNADGMADMQSAVLTDTIPDGFKLLTDKNDVPIVRITRYLPAILGQGVVVGPSEPEFVDAVDRGTTINNFPNKYRIYDVKQFTSYDYLDSAHPTYANMYRDAHGIPVTIPKPDAAKPHKDYWRNLITKGSQTVTIPDSGGLFYDKDLLTVNLGNIGHGSYDVSFLVISDRLLLDAEELANTATLNYEGGSSSSTTKNKVKWAQGAVASYTQKNAITAEGTVVKENPLLPGSDVTVKYQIATKSTDVTNPNDLKVDLFAGQIKVEDEILVPDGATLVSVDNFGVRATKYDKDADPKETPTTATAIVVGDVTFDSATNKLQFTNSKPMVENRRYYITFDVTYRNVPPGTIAKNILGEPVQSYVPLDITVVKVDSINTSIKLGKAEFIAYHANADGTAPDKTKPLSITDEDGTPIPGSKIITADTTGKADFFFAPSAEEFRAITATTPFVFFLVETKAPTGYLLNSTPIKYTVTKNATGDLLIIDDGRTIANELGSIETLAENREGEESPKIYDAALKKWVSKVQRPDGTDVSDQYNMNSSGTSALGDLYEKNTPTDPVKVKLGDYVTYKIRVYNQCDEDLVITEITDDAPAGLEFVSAGTLIDGVAVNAGWAMGTGANAGKLIWTGSLELAKQTSPARTQNTYDASNSKTLELVFKVVAAGSPANNGVITNTAEIAEMTDTNGDKVGDNDSDYDENLENDGSVKDNEIEEHREDKSNNREDLTKDEDDHDIAKILLDEGAFYISKRKITDGGELPGATLEIYAADAQGNKTGTAIMTWVSETADKKIEGLPAGTYVLHEDAAPAGYALASDITFTVDAEGNVTDNGGGAVTADGTLVMNDEITSFYIGKREIAGVDELPGAKLIVYTTDAQGDKTTTIATTISGEVLSWTSETMDKKIEGLPAGTYILHEEVAPDGYLLATDIKFTLNADGTVTSAGHVINDADLDSEILIMEDVLEGDTSFFISKRKITGDAELPGAKLEIRNKETGEVVKSWTSGNTPEKIENLPAGTYILRETIAPDGYLIATDIEFTVDAAGKLTSTGEVINSGKMLIMRDAVEGDKSFFISKREITGDAELPGAKLEIRNKETGEVVKSWTSGNTPEKIEGLPAGTYILRETIAPNGYELATDIEFTVDANGNLTSTGEVSSDGKTLIMRDALKSVSSDDTSSDNKKGGDNPNIPLTDGIVPLIGFLLAVTFLAIATLMTTKRRRRTNR